MNESFIIGDRRVFIGVTLVLGGLAAFASGRAVARAWRPLWLLPLYGLLLASPCVSCIGRCSENRSALPSRR